jgi:hypothetical protein
MTQNLTFLCIAFLSALGLASCNLIGGGSGGTEVKHPTVDQMAELEKQWGVQPREVRSRQVTPPGGIETPLAPPRSGAPQVVTPDPVPLPQTAAPPVFEKPPQAATPAQIQKLKN